MRIDRFDLISYGHFTEKMLDLSAGEQGLHLIYGDNEAGKSTSLRALIAWLFGIPVRTKDNYLHSNPQLRLGGKLKLSTGEELEFVRRKGIKGTLLEPSSDTVLADSVLLSFLPAGMDETLFRKFHGIDHPGLVAGGKELLHESGDLGQALLSAAVGTASFRKILAELHNSAEELFAPRASQKRINRAVIDFKKAKKRIKEASLSVAEWKSLQKQLAETLVHIRQVEDTIGIKTREKNRLARCNRVKGVLAEHRELTSRIAEQGKVLLLPEDFDEKRKMWSGSLQVALEAKKRAKAKALRLEKEVQSLNINHKLLEKEESILSIYKELGAVEKTVRDRPQQDGKRRLLRNDAEVLLKGVRPGIVVDDAEQLRPLLNKKKWFAALVQKHSLLQQKRDNALSIRRDIQNEQQRAGKERAGVSHLSADLGELKASVATARKSGDLEQRLLEIEKRERDARTGCEIERKRLGRFTGSVDQLLQMAVPETATLDLFEKNIDDLDEQLRDLNRKKEELEEEKKQKEHTKKVLLLTDEVPTLLDLEESRDIRDRGWSLIRSKYINKDVVDVKSVQISPATDLAVFYEEKVEGADRVSDQLRLAADQVAKRADLEVQIEDLASQLSVIEKKNRLVVKAREDCQKKWDEIWQSTGIQAGTPKEMRQWLLKVETLSANVQLACDIADDARKLNGDCTVLKENISRQIARFDKQIDVKTMSLEAMIIFCEQRIDKEESALEKKRQLDHLLEDLKIRKKRIDEELQVIEGEQANWRAEWVKAIDGLGLPLDVHPEPASETFERLVAFFEKFDQSEKLRKRIFGIDQVVEKFNTAVFAFTDAIGFKSDGLEPTAIAAQLHRDLNSAREARASLKKIEAQEREIREEIEEAEITISNAEKQFAELKKMAGAANDDELQQASDTSQKARLLQQKLDALEQELMRNGDGLTVQELKKEASELDNDIIESELERVVAELTELQENRDVLRDKRQTLVSEIGAKDDSGVAALASEEAEQHRATIVSGVEHYLRLRTAALILEQKIEEYRKKNQAPVLARAGELFARMTLGSYKGLRDELDNGKPVLLGVRPDEREVVVEGMSDGTRDQLYLALRLATLEQHLSKGEPLPFIVDDILIGFDDNRTRVCLEVFAELAQTTQVLLFTHHHRVIELAETHGIGDVFVHKLEDTLQN